ESLLGGEVRVAHLLRVASLPLAGLLEAELEERGAQALDLLAHGGPGVEGADGGAHGPRGRDGGEPRHAGADDQNLRRWRASGRRDLRGEEPAVALGRL